MTKDEETSAGMRAVHSPKWTESARVVWALIMAVVFLLGWIGNTMSGRIDKQEIVVEKLSLASDKSIEASTKAESAVKIQAEKLNTIIQYLIRLESDLKRHIEAK